MLDQVMARPPCAHLKGEIRKMMRCDRMREDERHCEQRKIFSNQERWGRKRREPGRKMGGEEGACIQTGR